MSEAPGRAGGKRPPRRITANYLQRAAKHYLERYSAPSAQLRRVLQRKIDLSCRHHGVEPGPFAPMLDDVVATCLRIGLVDDARFAEARAASLRRKGHSSRSVAAKLAAKGVGRDLAAQASETDQASEIESARRLAKRKRLGPWRRDGRAEYRPRDLAAMARAGYTYGIAKAIIDGAADDER